MPAPSNKSSSPTLVAPQSSSLAEFLGVGTASATATLQEAAQGLRATCSTAPEPTRPLTRNDVEGLSEDEDDDHLMLDRDLIHNRNQNLQSVVAPLGCRGNSSTTTTSSSSSSSSTGGLSQQAETTTIPPTTTIIVEVPTATELVEPSSILTRSQQYNHAELKELTSFAPHLVHAVPVGVYNEDDWDHPTDQPQPSAFPLDANSESSNDQSPRSRSSSHHARSVSHRNSATPENETDEELKKRREEEYNPECDCEDCLIVFLDRYEENAKIWGFKQKEEEQLLREAVHRLNVQKAQEEERQRQQQQEQEHQQSQYYSFSPQQEQQYQYHQYAQTTTSPGQQQFEQHHYQQQQQQQQQPHERQARQKVQKPKVKHEEQRRAMLAIHPRGSNGGNPNSKIACCYFLQKGYCKMGPDCWYSHDAPADAPCQYGAKCKAGHKHLAIEAAKKESSSCTSSCCGSSSTSGGCTTPCTTSASSSTHDSLSMALIPSSEPCHLCGAFAVMTQRFPVYNGNTRLLGTRAHCTQCLNTYSM